MSVSNENPHPDASTDTWQFPYVTVKQLQSCAETHIFPSPEVPLVLPRYTVPKQPCLSIIIVRPPVAPNDCLSAGGVSLHIPGYQRNFFFPRAWQLDKITPVSGQHFQNNSYLLTFLKAHTSRAFVQGIQTHSVTFCVFATLSSTCLYWSEVKGLWT